MILRGDFKSEILRSTTNIQILIPDGIIPPYRVVYLLHGQHGNQGTWLDLTALPYFARNYNAIFVMPEAGRSFYVNHIYGRRYFDYVSEELPDICRKIFNISAEVKDTAVMGCSMGGYGALLTVLTKPERFGFCGAISSALLFLKPILDGLREDSETYGNTGPEEKETLKDILAAWGINFEYNCDYDISALVENFSADKTKPVFYSTCGTEDSLREENLKFNELMISKNFNFTYEEWKGGHEWYFFNDALKKTLEFWKGLET